MKLIQILGLGSNLRACFDPAPRHCPRLITAQYSRRIVLSRERFCLCATSETASSSNQNAT